MMTSSNQKTDLFLFTVIKVILLATVPLLTLDSIHVRFILKNMANDMTILRVYAEKQAVDINSLKRVYFRRKTSFPSDVHYLRRAKRHVDNRDTLLKFLKYLSIGRNLPSTCIANHTVICLPGQKGEEGNRGKAGPIGPIGRKGRKGDMGLFGQQGPVGKKGETGNMGLKGQKGQKGASGKSIYSPVITSGPKSVSVLEGRNVTFFCEADGHPMPEIKWQFENKTKNKGRYHVSGQNGLTIPNVREHDSGRILCIANNLLGTESRHATLTVLVKPRVTVLPKRIEAVICSRVNINCNVRGNPSPTVSWRKAYGTLRTSGTTTSSGKILSLQNVREKDTGIYICSANNSVGSALDTSIVAVTDGICGVDNCDIRDALVMNLKMNELSGNDMSDSSGHENHGKAVKGHQNLSMFSRGRKLDNYAYIDVKVATSINFGTSSFTVIGWLKYTDVTYPRTTFGIRKGPLCYRKTAGSPHPSWEIGHHYNPACIYVCIQDEQGQMIRQCLYYNAGNQPKDLLNTWNHYAFVFDRNLKKIMAYVNGKRQDDVVDIGTVTGSVNNAALLRIGELSGWYIRGMIDEYRLYNQALSGWEINKIYKCKA